MLLAYPALLLLYLTVLLVYTTRLRHCKLMF